MEDLKQLLSCLNAKSSLEDIKETFEKIANILLLHTEIAIGENIRYTLEEIEFYYYNKGVFEEDYHTCTYPRDCDACDFFWHYSGVDICFQSYNDAFGGILIRSLRKNIYNADEGLIGGPMRCATDLANCSIKTGNKIKLIIHDNNIKTSSTPSKTIRQGIKADYEVLDGNIKTIKPVVEYCYYLPQENKWKRSKDDMHVLVEDKLTKKKSYVKKIRTDYYKDNPEDRVNNIQKALNNKKTLK